MVPRAPRQNAEETKLGSASSQSICLTSGIGTIRTHNSLCVGGLAPCRRDRFPRVTRRRTYRIGTAYLTVYSIRILAINGLDRPARGVQNSVMERWPDLPYGAWKDSCTTLQLWTQIVGKTR